MDHFIEYLNDIVPIFLDYIFLVFVKKNFRLFLRLIMLVGAPAVTTPVNSNGNGKGIKVDSGCHFQPSLPRDRG